MNHSDLSRCTPDGAHLMPSGTHSISRRAQLLAAATLLALAALALLAVPRAGAISDAEELFKVGKVGQGAGDLNLPTGVATDPATGHLFAADNGNNRVSEFTPWGNFVKAFGWDVAPGAVNEQQEVRIRAAGGQFKLSFGAESTGNLEFDATAADVEAALNGLASIGSGGVSVEGVPGTTNGVSPYVYVVAFKGPSPAGTDVAQLTASNGTTTLNGGVPSTELTVRTRADGHAASTGLESCTEESGCKAGLAAGGGAGQLNGPRYLAVAPGGEIFVQEGNRVQKLDSAGRFLLMIGREVNKTTGANRCTKADLEAGDECQGAVSVEGVAGPGEFKGSEGIALCAGALCPSGALFVADPERIQRFSLAGEYESQLAVSGVSSLALDPFSEDFYASFVTKEDIHKLDSSTGATIGQPLPNRAPVTTDPAGNVFTTSDDGKVLQYDSAGKPLSPPSCCQGELLPPPNGEKLHFGLRGLGTNAIGTLYAAYGTPSVDSFIRAFGPGPASFEGPPPVPPTISTQFAGSVGRTDAVLAAEINPHFWTNTRYFVQYGTGKCSEGGCEAQKPLGEGGLLTTKIFGSPVSSPGIILEDLEPGTTYHYRFVAQSGGGGPVRGIGGEVGIDGGESTFTTYAALAPPKSDCPNQAFRTGFSAPLPDCRAFEMVSPIDKNGGDIKSLLDSPAYNTALSQSSTDGERFTYSSYRAFANPKASTWTNQYLASRDPGSGWSSEALNIAQESTEIDSGSFENFYQAFSPDLCTSWLKVAGDALGQYNLLRREGCAGESFEALIQVEPTESTFPVLRGASADGSEAIFAASSKLTPDAAGGVVQIYYASEGELRLVCILPSGLPSGDDCLAGTGGRDDSGIASGTPFLEREASLPHAISADGSRVYWTTPNPVEEAGPGKVYLRLNPGEEQSAVSGGECTEADKACTIKVSETASSKASRYLNATPDGSKALFEITEGAQAGSLFKFELGEAPSSNLIAAKGLGVAAASEDLSRVYFVSQEAIAETSGATAGKPNLYLDEEGSVTFIATLGKDDVATGGAVSNTNPIPIYHAARATPDGSRLAFISTESLTGYDNTDQVSGQPDSEVYLYEAGAAGPVCASCNPSGARPQGRVAKVNHGGVFLARAGFLAVPETALFSPRVLSADGQRLFFDSYDALLPRDTNGKADVYEWEAASGAKDCEKKGAELYVESSGGCLSLISSGESPVDSEFLDASPSGDDVFFTTNAGLLPQDPGLIDVYDARANGGLPGPPSPPAPCQGEACQNAPAPPNDPTPASASFKGAGNPGAKPKSRCAKGKARRKGRCVAKRQKRAKKHSRDANQNRRAGR